MNFEWDEDKNLINIKKHDISFKDASYVLSDLEALSIYNDEHSDYEDRWITIGRIAISGIIVVIHTDRIRGEFEYIRIISARKANKKEINNYISQLRG